MKVKTLKACINCRYLATEEEFRTKDGKWRCPVCGSEEKPTREWQGYVIIMDYTKSDIAKKMGIEHNGRYALKVRGES